MKRVSLIGHLGQDPELRYLTNGQAVGRFSVATDESYTDREGNRQEHTEWHQVVVLGKVAETCSKYLAKGRQVVRCESFIGDGGGPPGVDLQEQIPNHHKLRG